MATSRSTHDGSQCIYKGFHMGTHMLKIQDFLCHLYSVWVHRNPCAELWSKSSTRDSQQDIKCSGFDTSLISDTDGN